MTLKAECPFCDWSVRQDVGDNLKKPLAQAYMAKGLIQHLMLNHSRHDVMKVPDQNIAFSTIMGQATGEGMVEMSLDDKLTQMNLDKAREVHQMLGEAIEAAASDWLIMKFFMEKVGFDQQKAAAVLMDFRELRHGSRAGGRREREM